MVGRINGRFASPGYDPIHYISQNLDSDGSPRSIARPTIALVTPLRDGMNLVAKEFVASRADGDGVLILSEFAGAAAELTDALLVNPYDQDSVASDHPPRPRNARGGAPGTDGRPSRAGPGPRRASLGARVRECAAARSSTGRLGTRAWSRREHPGGDRAGHPFARTRRRVDT